MARTCTSHNSLLCIASINEFASAFTVNRVCQITISLFFKVDDFGMNKPFLYLYTCFILL